MLASMLASTRWPSIGLGESTCASIGLGASIELDASGLAGEA